MTYPRARRSTRRRTAVAAAVGVALLAGCTPATPVAVPTGAATGATTVSPLPVPTPAVTEPGFSNPVADPVYPAHGNPALDVLHYGLALTWAPATGTLSGTATLTIRTVTAVPDLSLDFSSAFTIDKTTVDGRPLTAGRRGDDIVVPATLAAHAHTTLVVTYHGRPTTVAMPSQRGDFNEGLGLRATVGGEAWTMQEPFGAFTWYPANDQPSDEALYDISVTVPTGWTAIAQGTPAGETPSSAGDTWAWHSAAPVASYLATLAIGHYTRLTGTGPHGIPITYWLRTGRDEAFAAPLKDTPNLLSWLEARFGPYPFDTAGVVLVDSESAMETQQMITLGAKIDQSFSADDTREVLLHELAHQWFGDAVTPRDWNGLWLSEGWAMYAEWMWTVDQGWSTDERWEQRARTADLRSRPVAGPPGHPNAGHFAESNVYLGPALMLHKIRQAVGDDAFFAMARDWIRTYTGQSVDEQMFIDFVNAHTGHDLTTLMRAWLDSPTTPAA